MRIYSTKAVRRLRRPRHLRRQGSYRITAPAGTRRSINSSQWNSNRSCSEYVPTLRRHVSFLAIHLLIKLGGWGFMCVCMCGLSLILVGRDEEFRVSIFSAFFSLLRLTTINDLLQEAQQLLFLFFILCFYSIFFLGISFPFSLLTWPS